MAGLTSRSLNSLGQSQLVTWFMDFNCVNLLGHVDIMTHGRKL